MRLLRLRAIVHSLHIYRRTFLQCVTLRLRLRFKLQCVKLQLRQTFLQCVKLQLRRTFLQCVMLRLRQTFLQCVKLQLRLTRPLCLLHQSKPLLRLNVSRLHWMYLFCAIIGTNCRQPLKNLKQYVSFPSLQPFIALAIF